MSNPRVPALPSLAESDIRNHSHDGHVVQLYNDDGFLIDILSRFIGGALAVGDAAVVVATAPHRIELERRLSGRGVDTTKAATQGRYITLDASDTLPKFVVNGTVDESRFKEIIGGVLKQAKRVIHGEECRIAVFGE